MKRAAAVFTWVLLIVAAATFAAAWWLDRSGQTPQALGSNAAMLQSVRDLAEMETLSYVQRTVFPHEFYQPGVTLTDVLERLAALDGRIDDLARVDRDHLRAANLAQQVGLATDRSGRGFVVVTSVLTYGVDLSQLEELPSAQTPGAVVPPARLLGLEIEDIAADSYTFGPVRLDADGWRRVSAFVGERARSTAPEAELLEQAQEAAIELIEALSPTVAP